MAQQTAKDILLNDGRLCAAPSSLTTAFPHGGTALGSVRDVIFRPRAKTGFVTAEEFGGETIEAVQGGESPFLACILRGMDNDMISRVWPNSAAGSVSTDRVISAPGSNAPGRKRSDDSFALLFSPNDTANGRALIIFKALPIIIEDADIVFHKREESGVSVVFRAIRNSNGKLYQFGRLEDLSTS